eukprot:5464248-Heterocapsa_arctica.AAC.1
MAAARRSLLSAQRSQGAQFGTQLNIRKSYHNILPHVEKQGLSEAFLVSSNSVLRARALEPLGGHGGAAVTGAAKGSRAVRLYPRIT